MDRDVKIIASLPRSQSLIGHHAAKLTYAIARHEPDSLTVPFALDRFARGAPIDEAGSSPTPRLH